MKIKFFPTLAVAAGVSILIITAIITRPLASRLTAMPSPLGQVPGSIVNRVATDQKVVALTFDADMTYSMRERLAAGYVKSFYNSAVIDALRQAQAPATLFLTGLWIETYPTLTSELAADPLFEIANHSFDHASFISRCYRLPAVANARDISEVQRTDALLQQYAPGYKKYFRFPGLCYDRSDLTIVTNLGYQVVHGDVVSGDGFIRDPAALAERVVSRVRPGSIVILHMHGGPATATADALPVIITTLRSQGYRFVKVSELLAGP